MPILPTVEHTESAITQYSPLWVLGERVQLQVPVFNLSSAADATIPFTAEHDPTSWSSITNTTISLVTVAPPTAISVTRRYGIIPIPQPKIWSRYHLGDLINFLAKQSLIKPNLDSVFFVASDVEISQAAMLLSQWEPGEGARAIPSLVLRDLPLTKERWYMGIWSVDSLPFTYYITLNCRWYNVLYVRWWWRKQQRVECGMWSEWHIWVISMGQQGTGYRRTPSPLRVRQTGLPQCAGGYAFSQR